MHRSSALSTFRMTSRRFPGWDVRVGTQRRFLSSGQTHPLPPSPRGQFGRRLLTVGCVSAASLAAYTVGAIYPPSTITLLFPRPAQPPPDLTSPEGRIYTENVEKSLLSHPLLQRLRAQPDAELWYETRAYKNYPEERRVNNLSAGALRGPGRLTVSPLVRARRDESQGIVMVHVGRGLCGHDGIVHGGLLATLLDEALGRTAIANLPGKVGVTAKLELNYRAPTRADQFIVIHTFLTEVRGRKVKVTGRIEDTDGNLLVDASATFVQPRYAKLLNTGLLRMAMGEQPNSDDPVLLADGTKAPST